MIIRGPQPIKNIARMIQFLNRFKTGYHSAYQHYKIQCQIERHYIFEKGDKS